MPIFEFMCNKCGCSFEKSLKKSENEIPCKECGAKAFKRLSAPSGFSYEGKGAAFNEIPFGDRVVGRDSEIRHRILESQREAKTDILKSTEAKYLSKVNEKPLGSYTKNINPMTVKNSDLPKKESFMDSYTPISKEHTDLREQAKKIAKIAKSQ